MGSAARHHGRSPSGCGTASASGTRSRATSCRVRARCSPRSTTTAALLFGSLLVTLRITFLGLALAVAGGVGLAVLFAQSKWVEMSFFPFAVILQVTPIVAIFPLINIYVDNQTAKLLLCAWIVAFFPILSNTTLGPQVGRPQSPRPVQAQRRHQVAAALASAPASGDALFPRRPEDRRRPVADRRCGCRVRGGLDRAIVGACLAHHRGRLPAQRAAPLRRAHPHLASPAS